MSPNKLSFVLPITLNENLSRANWRLSTDQYAELRFELLIKTFLHNFDLQELDLFLIVCPKADVEFIVKSLKGLTSDHRFVIVNEEEVCPEFAKDTVPISGWYKQQMIKLAIANYIQTDYYLTLDSDVICSKTFSYSKLISSGKAYANIETILDYIELYSLKVGLKEWLIKFLRLRKSSKLLHYKRKLRNSSQSYGETPVLLHKQSVLGLLEELTSIHKDWFTALSSTEGWTEYTLYFQYLEKHDLLGKLYHKAGRSRVLDMDSSIWFLPGDYRKKVIFTPEYVLGGDGIFVVIQSYLDEQGWKPKNISNVDDYYKKIEEIIFSASK